RERDARAASRWACVSGESGDWGGQVRRGDTGESSSKKHEPRLGKLPPRYGFILNPYSDVRVSRCPKCQKPTHPRKFALFILIESCDAPLILGKTCGYCTGCELIVAHQDELEAELAEKFTALNPDVIGS